MTGLAQPLVVYLSNAIDEDCRLSRAITTDSPAASNKVLAIANAIQLTGSRCIILSLGRGRQNGKGAWHSAFCQRQKGILFIYCDFFHFPLFTHIISSVSLTILMMKLVSRNPNLVLLAYNRSFHYIFTLIYAQLTHVRCYLDLEDGYINEGSKFFRLFKNACVRWIYGWLCSSGAMITNIGLARQLTLPPKFVCYGVVENNDSPCQNWRAKRLQVLFSGTLLEEVGSKLLITTINILREKYPDLVNHLHFIVTGKGPFSDDFYTLATLAPDWLSFGGLMPRSAYLKILRESHVGLNLRITDFEMSATTFPSKVIEYAEHGLLIVSTRVSDVPLLFGDAAIYLENETAGALVTLLVSLPTWRNDFPRIASLGRERIFQICSPIAIGSSITNMFLK